MKNIVTIIFLVSVICSVSSQVNAQSINLESTIYSDKSGVELSMQRVEVSTKTYKIKYDYKANGNDVLGIIMPKIWSDSTSILSGMIVKAGDGKNDRFCADLWLTKKFSRFSVMIDGGRIFSQDIPQDFLGLRFTHKLFTAEAYAVACHPFHEKLNKKDVLYAWLAYHPKHAYYSLGRQDKQYWAFFGTKGLKRFGNFSAVNYQPQTKNFWFKSMFGFQEINQAYFRQENYILATSYLTVPLFYYLHFSPILTKGSLSLKLEGRKNSGVQNYEIMTGKMFDSNKGFAVGINSEYKNDLTLAPCFEAYKT